MRYLPLGRVYSSTAPCPPPKKPRSSASAGSKPPVIIYYRRRRKKPRLEEPRPSSPATAPRQPEEGALGRGSRQKRPLKHELLSLGSTRLHWARMEMGRSCCDDGSRGAEGD
ncbi:Trx1 [Hordeum vulgare]|nr:Trx1 [Hordeum vulgare]